MTEALLQALLVASGLFSAALGLVALLRPLLRRIAGAAAQYQLWLLVPAVLLAAGLAAQQPERTLRWQIELPAEELAATQPAQAGAAALTGAALPATASDWPAWLLASWLTGALGCAMVWGEAQRHLLRRRRLPAGGSAALVGAWRPRLRLPADFRQRFPVPERRLILLHERLHAERGDTRWLLLALCLLALQWFNPLAWWALHRLRADMELACDAALLRRHPEQLKPYRQALLRAQGLPVRLPWTATPCSSHPLIERLSMLPTHSLRPARRGVASLFIALAAGLAYAAQPVPTAPPPLEAPAAPAPPATPVIAPVAAPKPPSAVAAPKAKPMPAPPSAAELPAAPLPHTAPTAPTALLRTDLRLTVGGQVLEEAVLLEAFGQPGKRRFRLPNGQELELELRGMPADESRFPKESIQMTIGVVNLSTGEELARPRLVTGNGVEARVERGSQRADGSPAPDFIRIDLLARKMPAADADVDTARATLLSDIEAGRAPAAFKR